MEISSAKPVKAIIKSVSFLKEYETKFGIMYSFKISYEDKTAYYSCKKKEQTEFIQGQEKEFVEEEKKTEKGTYLTVKLAPKERNSNYSRQVKKEQSRYSGFAVSYVKDLVIAGKIEMKDFETYSEKIFNLMVRLDKTLES